MKLRSLAVLGALALALVACDSKSKSHRIEDDEEDTPRRRATSASASAAPSVTASAVASVTASASAAPPPSATVASTDDDAPPPPAPTEEPKPPLSKEQLETYLKDPSAAVTAEVFETALLALSDCTLDRYGVDYRCPARKSFNEVVRRRVDYKERARVSLKHIRHPKPAVRYQAALSAPDAAFGTEASDTAPKAYIDALRSESEPTVLVQLVTGLHLGARKSDRVKKVLVSLIDHGDSRVREAVLRRFSDHEVAKGTPGIFERLATVVEKDADDRVRAEACASLAATENDAAIPIFEKMLAAPDTPKEVFAGCFEGAIQMWVGSPYPKKPSKVAYEATMKILERPGRSKDLPPWRGMSKLGLAKTEFKTYDRDGKAWFDTAKAFYDKARLVRALEGIALDEKAEFLPRSSAMSALRQLGEQKRLKAMAPKIKVQKDRSSKMLFEQAERDAKEPTF